MKNKLVIDAFNFFYKWPETRGFFGTTNDMPAAVERALRIMSGFLGGMTKNGRLLAVIDGGLKSGRSQVAGLQVQYAGPGKKADDVILNMIRRSRHPGTLTIITADRELAMNAKALGARWMPVAKFLAELNKRKPTRPGSSESALPDKPMSKKSVAEWLEIFGDGSDIFEEEM